MVISQYCTDESVNKLIDYSVLVVDNICDSYNVPKEIRQTQYLVFAGMISYYGFDYIKEITEAFKKNKFIYINEPIPEFLAKRTSSSKKLIDSRTCAMYRPIYRDIYGDLNVSGEIILSSYYRNPPAEVLENMAHEINHAVFSVNLPGRVINGQFSNRMGIYTRNYTTDVRTNYILEESFNSLQAAEIMGHVLNFTNYNVKNRGVRYCLDSMRYAVNGKRMESGYGTVISVVKPLYEEKKFNVILNSGRLSGYISNIENVFNAKVGNGTFKTLSGLCDSIYYSNLDGSHNKVLEADRLVKSYVR